MKKDQMYWEILNMVREVISSKWSIEIMEILERNGTQGFAEIHKQLPAVTNAILSDRLKTMIEYKLVDKQEIINGNTKNTLYTLNENGKFQYDIFSKAFDKVISEIIKIKTPA